MSSAIIIDPPLAQAVSLGAVVIQYRTENLHIVPVFGPAALAVSPRIGHIHVTVDDATWHWADASGRNHQPIDQGAVQVTTPAAKPQPEAH